jgi:transcriptional regulator with XRE-family HTH domain
MPKEPLPEGHVLYDLGRLIRDQRRARGLSMRDFALLTGIGHTTLHYYEIGRRDPGIEMLIRIANQCDLSLSAFLAPLDHLRVRPQRAPWRGAPGGEA